MSGMHRNLSDLSSTGNNVSIKVKQYKYHRVRGALQFIRFIRSTGDQCPHCIHQSLQEPGCRQGFDIIKEPTAVFNKFSIYSGFDSSEGMQKNVVGFETRNKGIKATLVLNTLEDYLPYI